MHRFLSLICLLGCAVDHTGLIPSDSAPADTGMVDSGVVDAPDAKPDVSIPDSGPPPECNNNDTRACGDNPLLGECRPGQQRCTEGLWGPCRGGIGPAPELCDGTERDENCDGVVDEICDCVPGMTQECGTDEGACDLGTSTCGPDSQWGPCSEELTRGEEVCNEVDDDCDGMTDEAVTNTYYLDEDGDGYGIGASTTQACTVPAGYATEANDCRDSGDDSENYYPGAEERCNGQDDDCDSTMDEGLTPITYYVDDDRDGYGTRPAVFCADPGEEYAAVSGDCDDTTSSVNPMATEVCDGVDNDCNLAIDEGNICACPGVNYGGHNYLFCERDRGWTGSRGSCPGQGLYRLVIIDDAAEQAFIEGELASYAGGLRWWIGLDDRDTEGEFEWIDGTPQRSGSTIHTYDNFGAGEPNNSSTWGEDCVEIRPGGFWNDRECDDGASFICETFEP
ncbi:MAG: MopE-related protein [Polyangiales bacterium]